MMKIMMLSLTLITTMYFNNYIMIMSLLMMLMMTNLNSEFMTMNSITLMDNISMLMMMLTTMSIMFILLSSSYFNKMKLLITQIFMILMMTFSMLNLLNFYILFELVLIPTMILITMMGKQPERLQATIYLIMYTITASLPLLLSIIFIKNNMTFITLSMIMYKSNLMSLMLMLAFLIKTPMFFTHLWLPKAHVEAPLEGSMVLAAILLKLGGYGLIRFLPMCIKSINTMNYWIISISMIGATTTSCNCIRQKDLKSLIAYSSVAHMGLMLTGLFSYSYMGLTGAIMMMIAHGFSSSALFLLANDLYMKYNSRNTIMFKNMLIITPNITFWWFVFMAINISAPPTMNTISEIMLMSSMISFNNMNMLIMFMLSMMTTSFSMLMFINIAHNKKILAPSSPTNQKIFLSFMMHSTPLMMILMKMEMFM